MEALPPRIGVDRKQKIMPKEEIETEKKSIKNIHYACVGEDYSVNAQKINSC